MKQSTFSAQVANNLLTVLQGYSKTIRLLLVMLLTLTVTTNAWGETVTFTPSNCTNWTSSQAEQTQTIDGITLHSTGAANNTQLRLYSGATHTFTSTVGNITSILFTCTANGTNNYGPGKMTGDGYVAGTGKTGEWTGNSATVTLTGGQSRCTSIVVTYTPSSGGGGGSTPTQLAAPTGLTVGNITSSGATLSWNAVANASSYIVTIVDEASLKQDYPATGTTKTVNDLTPSTDYLWTVTAVGDGINYTNSEESSEIGEFTTSAAGGGGGEETWTLVTNASDLKAGDQVVIAAKDYNYAISTTQNNNNRGQAAITKSGDNITFGSDVQILTLEAGTKSSTFGLNTGSGYLYASSSSGNQLKTQATNNDNGSWSISISSGTATIKASGTNTRNTMQYNQSSSLFACYSSASQKALAIYKKVTSSGGDDPTPTPTLNVDPATLTFENTTTNTSTQKTFTLTGSNLTANASLQLSGINPGMFSLSSNSVTQSAGSINQTITVTYTPTATGSHNATLTISSTGAESKTVTLSGTGVAPAPTYTVTFNAGSGTCDDESLTETSGGAGVTLPTANPPATCATDGWEFAGWWTEEVTETTTSPGELLTADSNYKPASDCTLYAVYSHTEAGGSGGSSEITLLPSSFPDKGTNNYDSGAERTATENDIEFGGHHITGNASNTPSGATQNQYLQCRASDATIYNKTELPGKITQIVVNQYDAKAFSLYCGSTQLMASDNVDRTQTPSGTKITDVSAATTMTWDVDGNYTFFALKKGSNAGYVQSIIITYSGGGSTTTYNSNPVCVPSWSITYDFEGGTGSHCSNTSVPQGDPYTICDEAPTKDGNTFLHWSYGVNTYNPSDVIATVTTDITLTAVWQPNTYTVTWSDKGVTTPPIVYNHGETLEVPLTDPTPCDGEKEFVGWTEQSGYYHATTAPTDLFKTTTATVTADKTYYAVFATKGEGSANFVLGESGTFKMYANVEGTNYYAQGGVSSNKITSTTEAANASDYTLTYADGVYTIKQGTSNVGNKTGDADLNTNETTWTISEGTNGSWRVTSNVSTSRALSYSTSASAFKAYATSNIESGSYYDIEFGGTSSGYSDYTTTCQQIESIEVQNPQTEFYITDDFTIGSGEVIANLSGGGTTNVTALATFSGYNMNVVGTYTITVTYMGATATYEITVKPLDNAWVLTWNVSGKTNTGLGPRSVTKGNAIGTLPVPEVPAACAGKTFMGWTESNIVPSDGKGIVYITEATVPSKNTTYYAVFATVNNFSVQKPIDDIESGSNVVIVAVASLTDDGGAGKAISSRATDDTYNLQGDDVAIYDQTINTPHSTCIWKITKSGGKCIFTQDGKYLNAISDNGHYNLRYSNTQDTWTITNVVGMVNTYRMQSTVTNYFAEFFKGKFTLYKEANDKGDFDMQFYVTANADGNADITDYTTGCAEYTITYYGFHGGYSTSCSSDGTIVLPVNSLHTVPDCGDVVKDHTNLGREFLNVWMTQPHGGHTFMPGDTFILTQDTTLYAQWKLNTQNDFTTLPTDVEDLAGTDVYVYGGKTLTLQPGTTTINSLTLKGGIQADSTYKMPTVWVPEGATLVRNSNKIYLDLVVNAKTYYPFAVPFATKNDQYIDYLDPVLNAASTYDDHFVIKTYDGARRATQGEDRANNWVKVLRHQSAEKPSYLQPGVGYIITALTRPDKDTATIRIPMTVPNTWFQNGEQAVVGTTVRNTIAVTAHAGAAATEHQRHAGWNFVANPYLTSFTGGNVANDDGLAYINGQLIIEGSYEYTDEEVPYVTIPAYNFAYYDQVKLSEVKLSPEWSFFVQVGTGGTMNFTTAGRQQAPASIAARNAEERPVKMDVDLILSDNHNSDQTGIIICDRYSDAYEIGRDLEKLFGSAYNLSVYTLMEDNTPLAFQALAIRSSMQVIPVGYRAPEQGEYTFRLNEATSSIDLLNEQYEQLVLVDYQTGELTNLLYTDYTFYSERTQSNSRFAIYAVPRQNAPTDLPNAIGSDEEVRKVIYNDHLYILRDGNVYNGMGQKM